MKGLKCSHRAIYWSCGTVKKPKKGKAIKAHVWLGVQPRLRYETVSSSTYVTEEFSFFKMFSSALQKIMILNHDFTDNTEYVFILISDTGFLDARGILKN